MSTPDDCLPECQTHVSSLNFGPIFLIKIALHLKKDLLAKPKGQFVEKKTKQTLQTLELKALWSGQNFPREQRGIMKSLTRNAFISLAILIETNVLILCL